MRNLLTYLGLLCTLTSFGQHSPLISQYMLNGLVINPAYAGSRDVMTVNAMYRNQWVGFDGAPVTQVVSAHAPIKDKALSAGVLFNRENIGVTQSVAFSGQVSYRIDMGTGKLAFGLSAGGNMLSARYSELTTADGNDLVFAGDMQSHFQPDFGAGVYYSNKRFFAGFSVPTFAGRQYHFTNDRVSMRSDPSHYNYILHGGYLIDLNEDFKLKPSTLIRFTPAGTHQFDLNSNLIYRDRFWIGVSYRHKEAVVGLLEFQINDQFRIGYAYDYALNMFRLYSGGSHEIGLQYEFGFRVKSMDPRFF